jgi:hypothetical protein
MVSDIVLLKPLPQSVQKNVEAYAGCIAGAETKDKYLELIRKAGFQDVRIIDEKTYPLEYIISEDTLEKAIKLSSLTEEELKQTANTVVSVKVSALKK